jgi:hypothetical protein
MRQSRCLLWRNACGEAATCGKAAAKLSRCEMHRKTRRQGRCYTPQCGRAVAASACGEAAAGCTGKQGGKSAAKLSSLAAARTATATANHFSLKRSRLAHRTSPHDQVFSSSSNRHTLSMDSKMGKRRALSIAYRLFAARYLSRDLRNLFRGSRSGSSALAKTCRALFMICDISNSAPP